MIPGVILHKEETESTMDDARAAVEAGRGHGTVCSAERQRRGRGRMPGRRWENGDAAILFTLILRRDSVRAAYPLTQLLALALCRRLEGAYGVPVRIKWPNDVLADSRKIAGILVETQGEFYLAGIGLNVKVPAPADPGVDLRLPAAGLAEWAAPPPPPPGDSSPVRRDPPLPAHPAPPRRNHPAARRNPKRSEPDHRMPSIAAKNHRNPPRTRRRRGPAGRTPQRGNSNPVQRRDRLCRKVLMIRVYFCIFLPGNTPHSAQTHP